MIKNRIIFRKIKQDNCFDIQQIVKESHFTVKLTENLQRFVIFQSVNERILTSY